MDEIKYRHRVQYYETDKMGIVHHSNYIRWFEEARVDFFEQVGYRFQAIEESGLVSPVLSVNCNYRKMTFFGEDVYIKPLITSFNGVKLHVRYEVTGVSDGVLRADGESTHCFLNMNQRPVNLKKVNTQLYDILMEHLEPEGKAL